ncbi:MAG: hypothetical protein K2M90_04640 [Treponemataceae bacterium]|nr:hypothetical protein [Treponemataceae bacterium]MDE7140404.1 hypothetical protein [Treponemataceae bacterium]MDE7391739.1 hypothetical protein [Treponemataceae bacterium]
MTVVPQPFVPAEELHLDYHFTRREIRILARFLRNNQALLPDGLEDFAQAVEAAVYDAMSVDEAEAFYL